MVKQLNSPKQQSTSPKQQSFFTQGLGFVQQNLLLFIGVSAISAGLLAFAATNLTKEAVCDPPCDSGAFAYGSECFNGTCQCPSNAPDECSGFCVDISTDGNNCGECDKACPGLTDPFGAVCLNGLCVCGPGSTQCSSQGLAICVNTNNTLAHCGACENDCDVSFGLGAVCENGVCKCSTGTTFCPGKGCSNLASNSDSCGDCNTTCSGATGNCVNGVCVS